MTRRPRAALLSLAVLAAVLSGCAALRNEWSAKNGGPDVDDEVRLAVEHALPDATEVDVGSHKNGFAQEMTVGVTVPDASFDAEALLTAARAICEAVDLTDTVLVEVTDDSAARRLDLAPLVADSPLDTPYDPTEVRLEVAGDCPAL